MRTINWNEASNLGLIVRINSEILHPLGLSMSRDPSTGISKELFIADDGFWEYAEEVLKVSPIKSDEEIKAYLDGVE